MNEKKLTFSIDRLTIIGDILNDESFNDLYWNLTRMNDAYLCANVGSVMFEFSYNIDGLGYVQIDNPTKKLRIDFNPNKITLRGKEILNFLLNYTIKWESYPLLERGFNMLAHAHVKRVCKC